MEVPSSQEYRPLAGRVGLVVGIANERSIATGCARAFSAAGATLVATHLNERARPHVEAVATPLGAPSVELDVEVAGSAEAAFRMIEERHGRLDFLLHSIAFAPKEDLHGPLLECSREGFLRAMDVSCHSFIRLARLALPLLGEGGSLLTVSYLGAVRMVPNYGLMGPAKAALEAVVRHLAVELAPRGVRVNALSPGPIATRAASGIRDFDALIAAASARTPGGLLADVDDVGALAAFLVSPGARRITGQTLYVDGGFSITA